jgi:hypothetical protein
MSHHRIALWITATSGLLVMVDGWAFSVRERIPLWHGIYCIWMTAITVGGDITPTGWGYACLAFAPFPLLAAAISLFTSALASIHIRGAEARIKAHVSGHRGNT